MIVKNEEDVLARCLESVHDLVDEIIIVDTGSQDETKAIARRFTEHVHDFEWIDDFSAARNASFSFATGDYCMWLDADDVLLPADREQFMQLRKSLDPDVSVVMMKYNTGFDEHGHVTFSYYRERLIRNHAGMLWKGAVHEAIQPLGKILHSDCAVTHKKLHPSDPDRNLLIFEKQIERGEPLEPRHQFYYGRELYYHGEYERAVQVFTRFLDEGKGWRENNIDACCHCAYCYYGLGQEGAALCSLFRSLSYDVPRAEVCCDLGKHFFDREQYDRAIFWYHMALTCKRDDSRGGFSAPDCYNYIPCIQLCVCYSRIGNLEKAILFNDLAGQFKPDSQAVITNRAIFENTVSPV